MHATQPATFAAFERDARADGYDEILVREWLPAQVLGEHRHPFALKVWVIRGEVQLTRDGRTQLLQAGESFDIARDALHAEQYGSDGATFWVARRHPAAASCRRDPSVA